MLFCAVFTKNNFFFCVKIISSKSHLTDFSTFINPRPESDSNAMYSKVIEISMKNCH